MVAQVSKKSQVKQIKFSPGSKEGEQFIEAPVPASKMVPDWYKKITPFKQSEVKFSEENKVINLNLKSCMPFLDALTVGYIQKTWSDIHISIEDGELKYRVATNPELISFRKSVSADIGQGFYNIEFVWRTYWRAKLPEGYSVLITHPLNRLDLPFQTMTGFVDADHFYHTPVGNIPFFIKEGFTGIIPAGTPMYQIIPIKRDDWKMEKVDFDEIKVKQLEHKIESIFWGAYKKLFRQNKSYT